MDLLLGDLPLDGGACFGLRPDDVWWSTSDIGWIVGHSYIVYAPMLAGCTTLAYEGAIDHPDPETVWKIIEQFRVTGVFTSPTAVRLLMRYGEAPGHRHDLSALERVFCAGEVLNAPAWEWLQEKVLRGRVPVIDHMWPTETAGPVFGNPYGIAMLPIKPARPRCRCRASRRRSSRWTGRRAAPARRASWSSPVRSRA